MATLFGFLSIAFGVLAGGLGVRTARIVVRDSMDDFMGDLKRQSQWATWTAMAAGAAATCQALEKIL